MIEWVMFAIIGIFAGISAGLLGLGGGLITVPALLYSFQFFGMPDEHLMHIAISTSLMAIIVTSLSSLLAHHRSHNVDWILMRRLTVGLTAGGFLGAYCATVVSSNGLQYIFAIYALLMSMRLWLSMPQSRHATRLLNQPTLFVFSSAFGAISALVGMGGGTMVVPYLLLAGQTIQRAIGTSAACAFPIAISGVAGFMLFGLQPDTDNPWQIGYVNWQAFLGVVSTSVLFAPIGAFWARQLPVKRLQRLFSLVLIAVSLSLFFG